MLARMLRVSAGLELLAGALLAYALMQFGIPTIPAVLLALLLPVAVHAVPLAIEFVTGAIVDRRPVVRLSPWALARVWLNETARAFARSISTQLANHGQSADPGVEDADRSAALRRHS
jgi:hypothetical protein